jgi:hypothetical protein
VSRERIIEMSWRCSGCQHENLGRYKTCQSCGNPKDASEEFIMPSDTAAAPTVTDESLLHAANAGPDWRCRYCGGHQRSFDRHCVNCGAARAENGPAMAPAAPPPRKSEGSALRLITIVGAVIAALAWYAGRPREYQATVSAVQWEHVIEVDRYGLWSHEGFKEAIPAGAVKVTRIGRGVHHQEQVFDRFTTERYTVQVPDGYETERYSVREACGEDCTTEPETCREVCTSNQNGFASCKTVCTGGGQKCRPRYCRETRTREVPKTRAEWREKQVPVYRQEPRYADIFGYRVREWGLDRTTREGGTDINGLRWPEGARTAGLATGEQERERRRATYLVTLRYRDTETFRFEVTKPERFARFPAGSTHTIRREAGKVFVDGNVVKPVP